jgi:uncharacterized protein (TIGR02996 family)
MGGRDVSDATELGLLRAVLNDPHDDTLRLIYADALEENAREGVCPTCNGRRTVRSRTRTAEMDPTEYGVSWSTCDRCSGSGHVSDGRRERAEFIRVQCELARRGWRLDQVGPGLGEEYGELVALRQQEQELWPKLANHFVASLGTAWNDQSAVHPVGFPLGRSLERRYLVRRGFVESVSCDLATLFGEECDDCDGTGRSAAIPDADWRCDSCSGAGRTPGVAAALFASQPIAVTLTDREPWVQAVEPRLVGWWESAPQHADQGDTLPTVLMETMAGDSGRHDWGIATRFHVGADGKRDSAPGGCILFSTRAAALSALSTAAVNLGRSCAEGMTHEAKCEGCGFLKPGASLRADCPDCDGKGTVRKPGLPPLAGRGAVTVS